MNFIISVLKSSCHQLLDSRIKKNGVPLRKINVTLI